MSNFMFGLGSGAAVVAHDYWLAVAWLVIAICVHGAIAWASR